MFNSATSHSQAKSTVNKLLANFLPGSQTPATTKSKKLSSAEKASNEISKKSNTEDIKRIASKTKKIQKKKILKASETSKKFQKLAKYSSIKAHKESGTLTPEEQKYLNKLVKKNVSAINSLTEIDDDELKDELKQVKRDILAVTTPKKIKKLSKKNSKQSDFDSKVKKGFISYPGLTPGLAPVDYNESDSE